jgi:predicted small integral membrane protein
MTLRAAKTFLVTGVAIFYTLVVMNNITDYDSNHQFVRHAAFHMAKKWAIAGLTMGALMWLIAFLCVGGEWFLMWQSKTWNEQEAAFRMFAVVGIILLFLVQREEESQP